MKIDWELVMALVIAGVLLIALEKFVVNPLLEKLEESFEGE